MPRCARPREFRTRAPGSSAPCPSGLPGWRADPGSPGSGRQTGVWCP